MGACHARQIQGHDIPSHQRSHAKLRKKVSSTLEKSRTRHLSEVLASSQTDLTSVEKTTKERGKPPVSRFDNTAGTRDTEGSPPGGSDVYCGSDVGIMVRSSDAGDDDSIGGDVTGGDVSGGELNATDETERDRHKLRVPIRKGRPSFQPLGRYDRSSSFHNEVDHKAAKVQPHLFRFPFQNLVFGGGGNKVQSYCGAVKYLEEVGVMQQVRRLAGASAGALVATLLAVGHSATEVEHIMADSTDRIYMDACCGYCSLVPNILCTFGWNPGRRLTDWLGDKLRHKAGSADITFLQVLEKFGRELCVVVTNLNQMSTEYCHPKTTPDMPVRIAVRMSMATPGLFSAVKYGQSGEEDVYVDGGVLCNFPIHCYDGWYLSMEPDDSFIRRLQPLRDLAVLMERNQRFGSYNPDSLGLLSYSDTEEDLLRIQLERRVGCLIPPKPGRDTKVFMQRQREARQKRRAEREYAQVVQAVDSFLRVLKKHNMDDNTDVINRQELEAAFQDEAEFPRCQAEVLFGKDFTVSDAFRLLDRDDNGLIRYDELVRFIEENGVCLQSRFLGYGRREITSFVSFLNSLTSTLTFNVQKLYVEERDLDRTVGVNTGHVHGTDFSLEEADRDFLVQRGYNSMQAYLKYYVVLHPNNVHPQTKDVCNIPDIPETPVSSTPAAGGP